MKSSIFYSNKVFILMNGHKYRIVKFVCNDEERTLTLENSMMR